MIISTIWGVRVLHSEINYIKLEITFCQFQLTSERRKDPFTSHHRIILSGVHYKLHKVHSVDTDQLLGHLQQLLLNYPTANPEDWAEIEPRLTPQGLLHVR